MPALFVTKRFDGILGCGFAGRVVAKENADDGKAKADMIRKNTYRTLMTRGQKGCYFFSVDPETNAYFKARAAAISGGLLLKPEEKYPGLPLQVVDISPQEQYVTAVPLLNIKAAAGSFSMEQQLEVCDWVQLPEPLCTSRDILLCKW